MPGDTAEVRLGTLTSGASPEQLAVPVDVYGTDDLRASGAFDFLNTMRDLVPSIWVPQETIADLRSGVRPFQLRGLSPDHTLVLVNGVRRHSTAVVEVFGNSMPGSSGVDLNAVPWLALERVEVLRDGASARYGSGAVAGVVNLELRDDVSPLEVEVQTGKHVPRWFGDDGWKGRAAASGGFKVPGVGGVLNLTGEYLRRSPTSRAGASGRDQLAFGDGDELADVDDDPLLEVVQKNNPVPQPTFHIADGFYENRMVWWNYERRLGAEGEDGGGVKPGAGSEDVAGGRSGAGPELYLFGGWSDRTDRHSGFHRRGFSSRNWPQIYPLGFLPTFDADTRDVQVTGGARGRWGEWGYDVTGSFGRNRLDVAMTNTLNASLGPSLTEALAPGPDRTLGTPDDPGIPNSRTFRAGAIEQSLYLATLDLERELEVGTASPLAVSVGARFRADDYGILAGEPGSYLAGGHENQFDGSTEPGAQGFVGWRPEDEIDAVRVSGGLWAGAETEFTTGLLVQATARFEQYEGAGAAGAGGLALRFEPADRLVLRASAGVDFRAPTMGQSHWTHVRISCPFFCPDPDDFVEVGEFPVNSAAAKAVGAEPLASETARRAGGGVTWKPLPAVELSADGYYMRIDDAVVLSNSVGGPEAGILLADTDATSVRYSANALELDAFGADLAARFERRLSGNQTFALSAGLHVNRIDVLDVEEPEIASGFDDDQAAIAEQEFLERDVVDEIENRRPSETGVATLRYRWSGLEATLQGHYFGGTTELTDTDPDVVTTWPARATLDAELSYRFANGLRLSLGAENLTDEMPEPRLGLLGTEAGSFENIFWPGAPFPWMNGRYLYASARWRLE